MKTITSLLALAAVSLFAAAGCATQTDDAESEDTGEARSAMLKLDPEPVDCHFTNAGCAGDIVPNRPGTGAGGASGGVHIGNPSEPTEPPTSGGEPGQVDPPTHPTVTDRCVLACNDRYTSAGQRSACLSRCKVKVD